MSDLVLQRPAFVSGLAACAAGLAAYGLYSYINSRSHLRWVEVGRLSGILIHPVKACRGIEVTEADCTALGIRSKDGLHDRHYIILDGDNRMVTMRTKPCLALISTSLSEDGRFLQLDAPDMPTLRVPLHQAVTDEVIRFKVWRLQTEGYSCGREAESWLDTYIKTTGNKLVSYTTDLQPCINVQDPRWGPRAKPHERSAYTDWGQYTVASLTSLEDLNAKLEKKITMKRFRPSFIVDGVKEAWDEDNWKYVRIGEKVTLRRTHACGRCKQITVDTETAVVDDEPLRVLKTFRCYESSHPDYQGLSGSPVFSNQMHIEKEGAVEVGDTIYASY